MSLFHELPGREQALTHVIAFFNPEKGVRRYARHGQEPMARFHLRRFARKHGEAAVHVLELQMQQDLGDFCDRRAQALSARLNDETVRLQGGTMGSILETMRFWREEAAKHREIASALEGDQRIVDSN